MNIRAISHIAGKELRYIVFSPIGWIVFAVFAVQVGSAFLFLLEQLYESIAFGRKPTSIAAEVYTRSGLGMVARVVDIVYLYIPLLTMAVFSREFQSGSIKLLMSSPLRSVEIVLGKYLAVAITLILFVVGIVLTIPIAAWIAPDLDILAIMPGVLGVYLLACTYAAIGIFVSSLTKHQIVAAVVTFSVLFVLSAIGGWFRAVPFLNEVGHWASLSGRVGPFREGMIATHHIVYFTAIIFLFLTFTGLRISILRTGERFTSVFGQATVVTAIVVAVGWVLSLPQISAHIDATYDKRNSLSPESVAIMENLRGPWEIQTYANILDDNGQIGMVRERIRDKQRYRAYMQQNHQLSMRYELFYDLKANERLSEFNLGRPEIDVAYEYARRMRLDPDRLRSGGDFEAASGVDLSAEDYRTFRVFRWKDREAVVRFFDDSRRFPQERTRAAALKRLVDGSVQVGMLVSNGERRATRAWPTDYRRDFASPTNRLALINHGFDVSEISSEDWVGEDTDILVIADPREPYSQTALNLIENYVDSGGDLVLLVEGESSQSVDWLLQKLGFARGDALFQSHEEGYPETFVIGSPTGDVLTDYWGEGTLPVGLDGAVELLQTSQSNDFVRIPIVTAIEARRVGSEVSINKNDKPPIVGFALERVKNDQRQRILIFGDADLYSTAHNERRSPVTDNGLLDAFHYLTEGQYPVQRTRRETIDKTLNIERSGIDALRWLLVGVLPLAILLTGGWILMKRRRQ